VENKEARNVHSLSMENNTMFSPVESRDYSCVINHASVMSTVFQGNFERAKINLKLSTRIANMLSTKID
jgi:hypothetical protein